MVCNRCKSTVESELNTLGYEIDSIELGKVVINENKRSDNSKLEDILNKHGFEIIKEETDVLIEEIKIAIIKKIQDQNNENISVFLPKTFDKSYSALSKLFSKTEGMTLEKYEITLKIEKVKELIQLGQDNFSEIAYSLDYHNSSHLAKQFKNETGISMTEFKNLQNWDRKSLDGIV